MILHSDLRVGAVAKKQDKNEFNLFFLSGGEVVGEGQGRATLSSSCEEDAVAHKRCRSETRPQHSCRQQLPFTALHWMALRYGRKQQTQQQGGVISLHVDWLHRVKPKWVPFTCLCAAGVPDQCLQKPAENSLLWDSHAHIIPSTWAPPSLQHSLCCDLCFPACLHSWVGSMKSNEDAIFFFPLATPQSCFTDCQVLCAQSPKQGTLVHLPQLLFCHSLEDTTLLSPTSCLFGSAKACTKIVRSVRHVLSCTGAKSLPVGISQFVADFPSGPLMSFSVHHNYYF